MIRLRIPAALLIFTLMWVAVPRAFAETCAVENLSRSGNLQTYSVKAKTEHGTFYAIADLSNDGTLSLNFRMRVDDVRPEGLRGSVEFGRIVRHFDGRIKRIEGLWVAGSDNHAEFNRVLQSGISPEEAAARTWTGQHAAKYGFTRVTMEPTNGQSIRVYFQKPL